MFARFGVLALSAGFLVGCHGHRADQEKPAAATMPAAKPVAAKAKCITAGDVVQITVNDLVGIGIETTKESRVNGIGNISLPLIDEVKVAGLTPAQAEQAIANKYNQAKLIDKAQVCVEIVPPNSEAK